MSTDLANVSAHATAARDALAEVRAARTELYAFLTGMFDRLGALAAEQVAGLSHGDGSRAAGEEEGHQPLRPVEREAVQSQVEQLAAVAAELTELVAEQKRLLASAAVKLGACKAV